jgi:hypothetical protein
MTPDSRLATPGSIDKSGVSGSNVTFEPQKQCRLIEKPAFSLEFRLRSQNPGNRAIASSAVEELRGSLEALGDQLREGGGPSGGR